MNTARKGGWRLAIHEVLPSTSDLCRDRALAGEPGGLAVLARRQTGGRGSHGRTWESPVGNLFLSVLLRPEEPARDAAQWSLLAGVALADAVAPLLPDTSALTLKWPNDALLRGSKLAGILVDSMADGAGMLEWLVIGIGVNLTVAPELPDRKTACLAEIVPPPPPEALAEVVLDRLDHWRQRRAADGFAAIRTAWLERGPLPDAPIALRLGAATRGGEFAGLAQDGSLLLRSGGRMQAFAAGEIVP